MAWGEKVTNRECRVESESSQRRIAFLLTTGILWFFDRKISMNAKINSPAVRVKTIRCFWGLLLVVGGVFSQSIADGSEPVTVEQLEGPCFTEFLERQGKVPVWQRERPAVGIINLSGLPRWSMTAECTGCGITVGK